MKLPKLINRYTSSKDYYSYEKDYLYYISQLMKDSDITNINSLKYHVTNAQAKLQSNNRGRDVSIFLSACAFNPFLQNFPVYYISDELMELGFKTTIAPKLSISKCFTEKAIFLYPRKNKLNLKFTIVENNRDPFYHNHEDYLFSYSVFGEKYFKKGLFSHAEKKHMFDFDQLAFLDFSSSSSIDFKNISNIVLNIIGQIFLYMECYQEKGMSIESESSGQGFKQSSGKLLTPPTIGFNERHYVNQQRQSYGSNPDLQGIKKQTHWRRGHWRQYDNGKLTWIRPCLINPLNDDLD